MKLRKLSAIIPMIAIIGIATACSNKPAVSATPQATQVQSVMDDAQTNEAVGTISEIKNMQFVLTTDDGDALFTFDKAPEGLSTVKNGDMVLVHYTGEISPVDAFNGTVISVELYVE